MSAPDDTLRADEVVVVRITHTDGVHVHQAASWRNAGRYVEGWATVSRLLAVSMTIEPKDGTATRGACPPGQTSAKLPVYPPGHVLHDCVGCPH